MANNSKMSKSASIEDLRERNMQLEAEVVKLSSEMQEVLKRQDESSRKQEESHKALDEKLGNLSLMMERTLRQISGKSPTPLAGETSNINGRIRLNGDGHSRNQRNGTDWDGNENGTDPTFNMNEEEFQWANGCRRDRERLNRNEIRKGNNQFQLPRMEFPRFDGGDPKMWKMNCEFYFEMFEVPEMYKIRMAIMHFSEEMHEWYRCLTVGRHPLPWELLVDEVTARFQSVSIKHPVDEFKKIHQVGRVEEFIKRFDRTRARLLLEKPTLDEEFFVAGFISGLNEDIRHTVELFNPRGLNNAFQCALKVEAAQDSQGKRSKEVSKGIKYQKYPSFRQKTENEKLEGKQGYAQKPWQQQKPNPQKYTYEQRKELGLCHKCNGKYYPCHQCSGKIMGIESKSGLREESEEEQKDCEQEEQAVEVIEQAMLSMYAGCDRNKISSMKFKGYIGKVPVCILLDSGSTHSFVSSALVRKLELQG